MMPSKIPFLLTLLAAAVPSIGWPQTGNLVEVTSQSASRTISLPGEMLPYLNTSLYAKVPGYISRVLVDRGSIVKSGQLLAELNAPEMKAQVAEAESKARAAEADRLQADAQLAAAKSTYERLKKAAETPGVVAGNELIQAEKEMEAAQALLRSRQQASRAAEAVARAQKDLNSYLRIIAPFDGVITDRLVHPGALVGPGVDVPLLIVQQTSRLRLVVPVPEENLGKPRTGETISFRVPAYPTRTYTGKVARVSHAVDPKTRTMPIELDVLNRDRSLSPGMYPAVQWPVHRTGVALFVPKTSVVTTTERTFVIKEQSGRAHWVDVKKGVMNGDLMEVVGELKPGDRVVRRATDELQEGMLIPVKDNAK